MIREERNSNIELLRIIVALGVVVLHFNGSGAISMKQSFANKTLLLFIESMAIPAVNIFMILSGYFMIEKEKVSLWKPVELLFQVSIIDCMFFICSCFIFNIKIFSVEGLLYSIIPNNYFVIFYIVVYLLSIYINKLIKGLSFRNNMKLLLLLFIVFSIYPFVVDVLNWLLGFAFNKAITDISTITRIGALDGYTIVNFTLMYFIGANIRINKEKIKEMGLKKPIISYSICTVIVFLSTFFVYNYSNTIFEPGVTLSYGNPVVISQGISLVIFFINLKPAFNKLVNKIASASFMCYLVHIKIVGFFVQDMLLSMSVIELLLYLFMVVSFCYGISACVQFIYKYLEDYLFKKIISKVGNLDLHINDN